MLYSQTFMKCFRYKHLLGVNLNIFHVQRTSSITDQRNDIRVLENNNNNNNKHSNKDYCQRFYQQLNTTHKMEEKVYLRHQPSEDEVLINFRYKNDTLSVDREFNFRRKVTENIEVALSRIRNNIEKELFKRNKRRGKKAKAGEILMDNETNSSTIVDVNLEFRRGADSLTDISFAEILSDSERDQFELVILNSVYEVVINHPWVVSLVLPSTAMAGFVIYPSKLELQFADRTQCKVHWSKGKLSSDGKKLLPNENWISCSNELLYHSSNDDVGYHMKLSLTPRNEKGQEGPTVEQIMRNQLQAGPGPCPYQERALLYTNESLSHPEEFRVISYNLLADLYSDSDYSRKILFPYCPVYALKFDYRKQLFLQEIQSYKGDIVCLQEVDVKLFDGELKFLLENSTQNLMGLMAPKGKSGEGVATFYNPHKFDFVETNNINIGENIEKLSIFRSIHKQIQNNVNLMKRITMRSTTLQLTVLKFKNKINHDVKKTESTDTKDEIQSPKHYLIVANTHLYFHPDADHIRLLQMGFSMLYLEDVYNRLQLDVLKSNDTLSIVFCGDFNSTPDSGIYRLMTEQFVPSNIPDWSSNKDEAVRNLALQQPFKFLSAYGTPAFTNYTPAFSGCLDYIYYQSDRLNLKQIAPLPTIEEVTVHLGIPSVVFPSDHLSLVADFKLCS